MQSDRELLELAAKAAGIQLPAVGEYEYAGPGELLPNSWGILTYMGLGRVQFWNPLTDDGDCARLEAACSIDLDWSETFVTAYHWTLDGSPVAYFKDHGGDKNKARRYASTRAAAQLARAQEEKA